MELIELVRSVQMLAHEAGLAYNNSETDMVKVKLQLLLTLLNTNADIFRPAEPDKVEEPAEPEKSEPEVAADEKPEDPGPEAQPSDE